jgi:hypothetical protein
MASSSGSVNSRSSFDPLLPLLSADPGPFKPGTFFVEPRLELVLGRQPELVARHEYIAVACGREAHNLGVTFRAEQNPNGWGSPLDRQHARPGD